MDLLDPSVAVTETAEGMELDELRVALIDASASVAAAQARIAQAMSVFRARGGDQAGSGFTSFGQWASVDLETQLELQWRAGSDHGDLADGNDAAQPAPSAPRPTAARRADALVALAAAAQAAGPIPIVRGEHTEVALHVDEAFLTDSSTTTRSRFVPTATNISRSSTGSVNRSVHPIGHHPIDVTAPPATLEPEAAATRATPSTLPSPRWPLPAEYCRRARRDSNPQPSDP